MTPYWSLRFFLGLNVLADACIAWTDPLTRMAHLIDASGGVGWLVLATALLAAIDVTEQDPFTAMSRLGLKLIQAAL